MPEKSVIKFENPPIVEKVMGIQFQPLEKWLVPHFGLFWNKIKDNFPESKVQPALLQESTEYSFNSSIRCWFIHKFQTKLIQIQRDRFLYNWQKPTTYEEYPHYEAIRPEFKECWQSFCTFLDENEIGQPVIEACEITYIDHLERGREWSNLSELPTMFNCWSGLSGKLLHSEPDSVGIQLGYSLPDINGNLLIHLQPAVRNEDSKEIFQLRITVIGKPVSKNIDDVLFWFDSARDFAVTSFVEFTTKKMHEFWERRD